MWGCESGGWSSEGHRFKVHETPWYLRPLLSPPRFIKTLLLFLQLKSLLFSSILCGYIHIHLIKEIKTSAISFVISILLSFSIKTETLAENRMKLADLQLLRLACRDVRLETFLVMLAHFQENHQTWFSGDLQLMTSVLLFNLTHRTEKKIFLYMKNQSLMC